MRSPSSFPVFCAEQHASLVECSRRIPIISSPAKHHLNTSQTTFSLATDLFPFRNPSSRIRASEKKKKKDEKRKKNERRTKERTKERTKGENCLPALGDVEVRPQTHCPPRCEMAPAAGQSTIASNASCQYTHGTHPVAPRAFSMLPSSAQGPPAQSPLYSQTNHRNFATQPSSLSQKTNSQTKRAPLKNSTDAWSTLTPSISPLNRLQFHTQNQIKGEGEGCVHPATSKSFFLFHSFGKALAGFLTC